jgi:hypothetical protein
MTLKEDGKCECGGEQDADHLFACPYYRLSVERKIFLTHEISYKTKQIATYWEGKGI